MSRVAFICLLAGGCAIAFAPILVRLSDTGPVASAFWRCALAAPLLWLWVATIKGQTHYSADTNKVSDPLFRYLLAAGLFFAADLGVWHWSIIFTSVANSTLLANLAPIFVTLAGWLFWRQAVTRLFLAGMAVAIVGMFVLVGPNFGVALVRMIGVSLATSASAKQWGTKRVGWKDHSAWSKASSARRSRE